MKFFTYCALGHLYARVPTDYDIALLFGTDDGTEVTREDVLTIEQDPVVTHMFPTGFYSLPAAKGQWQITASLRFVQTPDHAKLEDPSLRVVFDGVSHTVNLHSRFNECRSLFKLMRCARCPEKGLSCLSSGEGLPSHTEVDPVRVDDLREVFRHKKTKIADFIYVSPATTKTEDFGSALRVAEEHDFTKVKPWTEMRQGASKVAAATRRFKGKQCTVCPLYLACPDHKVCEGAYPSTEEITRQVLATWLPRVKESGLKQWQFWELAQASGNEAVWKGKAVVLRGLEYYAHNRMWGILVYRAKTRIVKLANVSYAEAAKIFSLPTSAKNRKWSCTSDEAKALWFTSLDHNWGPRRGMYKDGQYFAVTKLLHSHGVDLGWSNARYLLGSQRVNSWAKFYEEFDKCPLPVPKVPFAR